MKIDPMSAMIESIVSGDLKNYKSLKNNQSVEDSGFNDGSCIRLRPEYPDHIRSYDFVADRTRDGRPI